MGKQVVAERIQQRRKALGLTLEDIASEIGVSRSTVQRYEKGTIGKLKLPVIEAIARVLRVAPEWLVGKTDEMVRKESHPGTTITEANNLIPLGFSPMPETKKVPRLGRIACGEPILAEENIEDYDEVPAYVRADFTLVCKGDSMINARIYDGDIVCIRQQEQVENGEIAAVLVDGDTATLKRVKLFPDHVVLEPENPTYRPLSFWEDDMNKVRIIGKATHFISVVR